MQRLLTALLRNFCLGDLMQKRSDLNICRSQQIAEALFARAQTFKDELFLRKDPRQK